ncbi:MAG: ribonuclease Z [Burkholderiaceae bacterium]|nr:ribonuclease Z [Burkholderiaceae bacterium]
MFQLLAPTLTDGPFGDPGLLVDLKGEKRALLFDLGDLSRLPPRVLMRIDDIFVSHTHMDHFAGFDGWLRVVLGRKQRVVLTGGPGFVDQVEHKLRAYTWNVVQRYPVALQLDVRELRPDGRWQRACFSSRSGFAREDAEPPALPAGVLHDDALLRVRAAFVDHGMPCLAFAIDGKPRPRVAPDRLAALGVTRGAWLRELKAAVLAGAPAETPIRVRWRDRAGAHEALRMVGELAAAVLDVVPGERIGYVTDLRFSDDNRARLRALLAGVDRLVIESVFLDADRAHAERKNHLTARQAGCIARELGARIVVPMHFSSRYLARGDELRAELRAAHAAGPARSA